MGSASNFFDDDDDDVMLMLKNLMIRDLHTAIQHPKIDYCQGSASVKIKQAKKLSFEIFIFSVSHKHVYSSNYLF